MPISTYGFLYPPFVAITPFQSIQGLTIGIDNKGIDFGIVNAVNYNCVRTQIGKNVIFDRGKAILVTHSQDNYFIVDENNIYFQEFDPL